MHPVLQRVQRHDQRTSSQDGYLELASADLEAVSAVAEHVPDVGLRPR
jgi:hypothetical protein